MFAARQTRVGTYTLRTGSIRCRRSCSLCVFYAPCKKRTDTAKKHLHRKSWHGHGRTEIAHEIGGGHRRMRYIHSARCACYGLRKMVLLRVEYSLCYRPTDRPTDRPTEIMGRVSALSSTCGCLCAICAEDEAVPVLPYICPSP